MNRVEENTVSFIAEKIRTLPPSNKAYKVLFQELQMSLNNRLLNLQVDGCKVTLNNHTVDLSRREKLAKVFGLFANEAHPAISRRDLIRQVYLGSETGISERQLDCLNHNVIKLISRARKIADSVFMDEDALPVEWFPYDARTKTWALYSVKEIAI